MILCASRCLKRKQLYKQVALDEQCRWRKSEIKLCQTLTTVPVTFNNSNNGAALVIIINPLNTAITKSHLVFHWACTRLMTTRNHLCPNMTTYLVVNIIIKRCGVVVSTLSAILCAASRFNYMIFAGRRLLSTLHRIYSVKRRRP